MFTQWLKWRVIRWCAMLVIAGLASTTLYAEEQVVAPSLTNASDTAVQQTVMGRQFTDCKSPRPEICYEVFRPVCAVRDTGVRCVTEPCPSTENTTYANDCKACSDQSVVRFQSGSCEDLAIELLVPKPLKKAEGVLAGK